MVVRFLFAALLVLSATVSAAAKEYHAARFDSRIEVQQGGSLRVTETIEFVFTDGTFREVFRAIPTRRTDGIEFVSASMNGTILPEGEGPGQVEVKRRNGFRVTWHFAPVSGSTHTFELTYIARGVVTQDDHEERLAWMALPREHQYHVQTSRVELVLPAAPLRTPEAVQDRVDGELRVEQLGLTTTVLASNIRRNGRVTVSMPFARGAILDGPPAWQSRQAAQLAKMPLWVGSGGGIVLVCLMLLFGLRQSDDHPPAERSVEWHSLIPPEPIPPAIAGLLVTNGRVQLEHAMATIFNLAERGIVTIREEPRGTFGQRNFVVQRTRAGEHLAPHEESVLDLIFARSSGAEASVSIAKARSYLMRGWSRFKQAMMRELADAGITDHTRLAQRRRYAVLGFVLLAMAGAATLICLILMRTYGGWPLFVPLGLLVGALSSFIVMSAHTPLSNDGVRRAQQWRAYKQHLSNPGEIESRWGSSGPAEARILPFAVALGLASAWAKFMKKSKGHTPAWFHAAAHGDPGAAFSVFVATGGAGASGGGAPGGGGVAGGGASGAR